jgi:hypothetical protein
MVPECLVRDSNTEIPNLREVYERGCADSRLGRRSYPGDGSKLAAHLNCALVEGKPQNYYGVSLLSPLELLKQDQGDQFVSPCDVACDFEGHNKNRHQGLRLMYECILDALNVEIDDEGYLRNFHVERKLNFSLGLGLGRDANVSGPPAQISHLCVLTNGGYCRDTRGHGEFLKIWG